MKTADEILAPLLMKTHGEMVVNLNSAKKAMKEYASQALDMAAEEARLSKDGGNIPYGEHYGDKCGSWTVNKQSILNFKNKLK